VIGRPGEETPATPATVELPESRLGSRIALAGREPPGALGAAVAELADRCEEAV
jgi:hypothetical protein